MKMLGNVLADVERRNRQDRRQQEIIALEEGAQLVAQRVALEYLLIIAAHLLIEGRFQDLGHGGIEKLALVLDETAKPSTDARIEFGRPEVAGVFFKHRIDLFDRTPE